ncbi:hypothetical protein ACFOPN_07100 [Xanthomonas hyacinthi]
MPASHLLGDHVQPVPDVIQALGEASGWVVLYQVGKQAIGNVELGFCGHK